jgi:peptidoglycan/xylan/chitin deacetylase (PgdA/CDA1 family)
MKKNLIANFHIVKDAHWFEKTILLLKSMYEMVDLSYFERADNIYRARGKCHITFDDGDLSFYETAYPVLKKHNVPATLFVSPKVLTEQNNFWFQEVAGYDSSIMKKIFSEELQIDENQLDNISFRSILKSLDLKSILHIIDTYQLQTNTKPKAFQNMNLEQVIEVKNSGLITIGAHTMNHPVLANESDDDSKTEILQSIVNLQKLLGHEVKYFAYPNGKPVLDFGRREMEYLEDAGIKIAVSMQIKHLSHKDHMLALPRIGITAGSPHFIKLKLLLGAGFEKIKSIIRLTENKQRKKIATLKTKDR